MYSILEEFACGNVSPENQYVKRGSKYDRAMKEVVGNEEKLLRILEGEEKITFQKFVDAQGEVNQQTAVNNFVYGFKLGLLMTAEAFMSSDGLINGKGAW